MLGAEVQTGNVLHGLPQMKELSGGVVAGLEVGTK